MIFATQHHCFYHICSNEWFKIHVASIFSFRDYFLLNRVFICCYLMVFRYRTKSNCLISNYEFTGQFINIKVNHSLITPHEPSSNWIFYNHKKLIILFQLAGIHKSLISVDCRKFKLKIRPMSLKLAIVILPNYIAIVKVNHRFQRQ